MECAKDDILQVHRSVAQNNEGPIFLSLKNEITKKNILQGVKELGNLKVKQLFPQTKEKDNMNIYINPQLTTYNMNLLKAAREFRKNHNYKYAWFSSINNKIYLKKDDESRKILITTVDDITKLKKNNHQ